MKLSPRQAIHLDRLDEVTKKVRPNGKAVFYLDGKDCTAVINSLRAKGVLIQGHASEKLIRSQL